MFYFKCQKMKKQQFTEAQIAAAFKRYEGCMGALDVCREYGISNPFTIGVKSTVVWIPRT